MAAFLKDPNKAPKLGQSFNQMRFPSDIKTEYCSISAVKYQRTLPSDPALLVSTGASVILPIPFSGLNDNYGMNYAEANTGAMGGALNTLMSNPLTGGIKLLAGGALSGIDEIAKGAAGGLADAVGLNRGTAREMTQQALGRVANPNMSLSFQGVSSRSHQFSWKLVAKSPAESKTIQDILRFFRSNSLPSKAAGADIQLNYPHIFLIEFYGPNQRLIMFSKQGLFLNNLSISYAEEAHPVFFKETGLPASIVLTATFLERMLVTADDADNYFGGGNLATTNL
jgi:hypothetical protein